MNLGWLAESALDTLVFVGTFVVVGLLWLQAFK